VFTSRYEMSLEIGVYFRLIFVYRVFIGRLLMALCVAARKKRGGFLLLA
jgi:hypothetical protein